MQFTRSNLISHDTCVTLPWTYDRRYTLKNSGASSLIHPFRLTYLWNRQLFGVFQPFRGASRTNETERGPETRSSWRWMQPASNCNGVINECVAITRVNWNSCDLTRGAHRTSSLPVSSVGDVISPVYVACFVQYIVFTEPRGLRLSAPWFTRLFCSWKWCAFTRTLPRNHRASVISGRERKGETFIFFWACVPAVFFVGRRRVTDNCRHGQGTCQTKGIEEGDMLRVCE